MKEMDKGQNIEMDEKQNKKQDNQDCSSCSSKTCDKKDCKTCANKKKIMKIPANPMNHIKHVVGIVSGKGGVGKSSVTSMIAVELLRRGYKVGILDADVTGPSIPQIFGVQWSLSGDLWTSTGTIKKQKRAYHVRNATIFL